MSLTESTQSSSEKHSAPIKIVMVQDVFQVGDIRTNADKIINASVEASRQGADLVVFPELALVGYPPEDLLHRQGFLAQVKDECLRIQQSLSDTIGYTGVVFGLPVEANGNLYNAAIYLVKGKITQTYFKQSLPNYSVFDELRYFTAGKESAVINVKGHLIGLLICEDVWQQDCVAQAKQDGAQALIVLNASPFHVGKHIDRVEVLRRNAKIFALPVMYLNMVGGQDELVFDGDSLVMNKRAQMIARAEVFEIDKLAIIFDGEDISAVGNSSIDVESLSTEALVYKALVTGVRDFVHQNGFSGVIIGLSGGVDSALTLAIAVDALGADNVQAVMMPSRYTADISLQDAEAEAQLLGVKYDVIAIEGVFNSFMTTLAPVFVGESADTTEENIQARCRGLLLMAMSNKKGRMVLTTGNKSEMAVGYATLYGDMCGGFAPIKDVCKTLVYKLCRYRNSVSDVIPERVLTRPPTAELRDNQCDQDSLPDYDVLDRILELSVEQDKPIDEIVAEGIDRETVLQIITLVQRNEHKRRQSAPGIRITRRAFGRDRRYPITSGYRRQ
jgi:NAD+ synthase (glutamine-hydrolysing)